MVLVKYYIKVKNMVKRLGVFVFSGLLLLNLYGCFALVAGTAAGAGTAVWLSDKLTQQFNASYDDTIKAAENALRSLRLELIKEARKIEVTQLRSKYTDGKEIWIDIHKITENSTKVEVRVGVVSSSREAANKILKRIQDSL
jgi:hypothetical protein